MTSAVVEFNVRADINICKGSLQNKIKRATLGIFAKQGGGGSDQVGQMSQPPYLGGGGSAEVWQMSQVLLFLFVEGFPYRIWMVVIICKLHNVKIRSLQ